MFKLFTKTTNTSLESLTLWILSIISCYNNNMRGAFPVGPN